VRKVPVLIDTSALYALADRDDGRHKEAISVRRMLEKDGTRVLTTNYLLVEAHSLILSHLGDDAARRFLSSFNIPLIQATEEDLRLGIELILAHSDKDYSLADSISFVIMKRMRIREAFSFDGHFAQAGFILLES
jgi:predicted nucleic acid-binding protein